MPKRDQTFILRQYVSSCLNGFLKKNLDKVASHILGDFVFILGNNILGKKNLDKG